MRNESTFLEENPNVHQEGTMRMMLDATGLLNEIEVFLKGYYMTSIYDDREKVSRNVKVEVGECKANDRGVQSIMMWLKTKITPLVSLGNLREEQYNDFLFRSRINLASNLMSNRIDYNISLSNYNEIVDYVMEMFEAFFTSAISGGHRKAVFTNSRMEHREVVEKNKGLFGRIV